MLNIILHEPQIPGNTGNIARTCSVTGAALHLIRPLGFTVDDTKLKRAGLDYWHDLRISYYDSFDVFPKHDNMWFFSTKAKTVYSDAAYYGDGGGDIYLMFGREDGGLPDRILREYAARCVRIPMLSDKRSLNLSNSVAIAVYEVLRQGGFAGLR